MARYQFDDDRGEAESWIDRSAHLMNLVVRAFGFVLMVVGLWVALAVISQAWSLYKEPQNIERFVRAIEQGSNLDRSLSATIRGNDSESAENADEPVHVESDRPRFRLSYFVAWIIAILLLMLVGRLAIAAVKTGGELALYDVQIKHFARLLVRASRTPQG